MSRGGGKDKVEKVETKDTWADCIGKFLVKLALKISPKLRAEQNQRKITEYGFAKEDCIAKVCLLKTFSTLNTYLGREEKAKKETKNDTLSDLTLKVCAMAELAGGLYSASEYRRVQVKDVLNEVLEPFRKELKARNKGDASLATEPSRDDFQAALEAVYRIKLLKIISDSFYGKLKEQREGNLK